MGGPGTAAQKRAKHLICRRPGPWRTHLRCRACCRQGIKPGAGNQLLPVRDNPSAPARAVNHLGPAAGIEPATLCLLGSRSSGLSYAGVWYPAQESNPETAGFADPPEIRLARQVVREAGLDPAADGL